MLYALHTPTCHTGESIEMERKIKSNHDDVEVHSIMLYVWCLMIYFGEFSVRPCAECIDNQTDRLDHPTKKQKIEN